MNTEIWSYVDGKEWGQLTKTIASIHRDRRRARRVSGSCAVYFALIALYNAYAGRLLVPLTDVCCCWFIYRLYLNNLRLEKTWYRCLHHAQRMLVETSERCIKHAETLKVILLTAYL